jgi:hypothetical protein
MKKSSKKGLIMSAAAVISATVLGVTAFAASTNVSGYEALKQSGFVILENSDNSTVFMDIELFVNGETVFSRNVFAQINHEQNASYNRSEMYAIGMDSYWYEDFRSDGLSHRVTSASPDEYQITYSHRIGNPGFNHNNFSENQKRFSGIVMDLFAGDIKNYFVMDGNTVSISLSRNQIPEIVQSFIAVVAETAVNEFSDPNRFSDNSVDNIIAQFLYSPVIDSGTMTAVLTDDGYPADIDVSISFSGRDENGGSHSATLNIKLGFSDIGSTDVKLFDPQGKTEWSHFDYDALDRYIHDTIDTEIGMEDLDILEYFGNLEDLENIEDLELLDGFGVLEVETTEQ